MSLRGGWVPHPGPRRSVWDQTRFGQDFHPDRVKDGRGPSGNACPGKTPQAAFGRVFTGRKTGETGSRCRDPRTCGEPFPWVGPGRPGGSAPKESRDRMPGPGKPRRSEGEAEAGEEDERDGIKRAYAIFLEPGWDPGFGSPNPPPSKSWFLFRYAHILIPPVLFPGGRRPWIRPAGRCALVLCHLCQLCNVRHFTQADGHVKEKMREGQKEGKTMFS